MKYSKNLVSAIIKAIEGAPCEAWWNVHTAVQDDEMLFAEIRFENADGMVHKFYVTCDNVECYFDANKRNKWMGSFHLKHCTRDTLMVGIGAMLFRFNMEYGKICGEECEDDD